LKRKKKKKKKRKKKKKKKEKEKVFTKQIKRTTKINYKFKYMHHLDIETLTQPAKINTKASKTHQSKLNKKINDLILHQSKVRAIYQQKKKRNDYSLEHTPATTDRLIISGLLGRAPWHAAGAQGDGVPQGVQPGRRRSSHQNRHGREGQRSWFGCTWHGSCPALSVLHSSHSLGKALASHGWAVPLPSAP
jgi:hypothetical protein